MRAHAEIDDMQRYIALGTFTRREAGAADLAANAAADALYGGVLDRGCADPGVPHSHKLLGSTGQPVG